MSIESRPTFEDLSDGTVPTKEERSHALETRPACVPFGPYAGMRVEEVAVVDPSYLLDLVREGIGEASFRAEAARVLALRKPGRSAALRFRPWIGGGFAGLLLLAIFVRGPSLLESRSLATDRPFLKAEAIESGVRAPETVDKDPGPISGSGSGMESKDAPGPASDPDSTGARAAADPDASTAIDFDAPCGARVPGAIPADSASDFLDSFQAVEFEVLRGKDTGKVTFLNSRDPYQGHFYVAIFPGDYAQFGGAPAQHFMNRCIIVHGLIETYRGSPQIVLRDAADLRVVERDIGE